MGPTHSHPTNILHKPPATHGLANASQQHEKSVKTGFRTYLDDNGSRFRAESTISRNNDGLYGRLRNEKSQLKLEDLYGVSDFPPIRSQRPYARQCADKNEIGQPPTSPTLSTPAAIGNKFTSRLLGFRVPTWSPSPNDWCLYNSLRGSGGTKTWRNRLLALEFLSMHDGASCPTPMTSRRSTRNTLHWQILASAD
ncbi:hypothetical protein CC2G_013320 [Coprinopsis cinerea AmutBmut pab1-1]|nr:hypothetical protein CC2G_013320 [Coprinopsis cinerea AmutBmut pab1-1]